MRGFAQGAAGVDIDDDRPFFVSLQGLINERRFPAPIAGAAREAEKGRLPYVVRHVRRRIQDYFVENAQPASLTSDPLQGIGHGFVGVGDENGLGHIRQTKPG